MYLARLSKIIIVNRLEKNRRKQNHQIVGEWRIQSITLIWNEESAPTSSTPILALESLESAKNESYAGSR
jgi:hypothetical protein